jgi:antiphage defense system Thoeris ThsB-like protein
VTKNPARVFTAFDYDHDESLKNLLVGQSKHEDTPFEMHDWSVKDPYPGDWKARVREKIRKVDQVIVLCGEHTHEATGVSAELKIAQEEQKPYFLLWGYSDKTCTKPNSALEADKIYKWTWDNLKDLLGGSR